MKKEAIIPLLRKCEDLGELDDSELSNLVDIGDIEVFSEGEEVFTINHRGEKFYVLLEGRLLLRLKNNQSKEYVGGQLFGEVAILGDTFRFGTICATQESLLISFKREKIINSDLISRDLALKVVLLLSRKAVSYFDDGVLIPSKKLIAKGECDYLEFKRSLNKQNKKDIVKTFAAFMNLNGGTVFCGVGDNDGEIVGLKYSLQKLDELTRNLMDEARRRIGVYFTNYVSFDVEQIDGKTVLRIDCDSSRSPVFYKDLDNKNEDGEPPEYFIVRTGSENVRLEKTRDIINFVHERFKK